MDQIALEPYIHHLHLSNGDRYELFGLLIPYLPDFLSDHTLLGENDQDRVAEVLNRWTQFVLSLRKWMGSAFSIRFQADPARGSTKCAVLARAPEGRAEQVASDLVVQLTSAGIAFEGLSMDALRSFLGPYPEPFHLVELRQHEEVTNLMAVRQAAYVVHPFWAPAGSLLLPFETMLRQKQPSSISLYLEPTALTADERGAMLDAAHKAQTFASTSSRQLSEQYDNFQRRDPEAELIGRVYSAQNKTLVEPFLIMAQVASPDPSVAWNVARAYGAALVAGQEQTAVQSGEKDLPTGFDLRRPRNERELQNARLGFVHLKFAIWGNELSSKSVHKDRLVFLTGPKGAAALFRFPISVRGGVPGLAVRQNAPDFEPGPRPEAAASDELQLGNFRRGGAVTIKRRQLTRHTLITGFTGAGKTNTVLYLLNQLWNDHDLPFLVIEAAKKEYRGLLGQPGFEDLQVYTLGDDTTSPFRLNPFELIPGVRLEAHLARLQTCFDAALPQFGILPSIISETLERIYVDKGWKLTDVCRPDNDKLFPTMQDMVATVNQVVEERGYAGEVYYNIRAATEGRLGGLLRGSKGRMFSCQRSLPFDELMHQPVVLELNDLNQQDKALTMMFLLMLLREYRELNRKSTLQHVTVVEEAHNVLENVQSVGASEVAADTRAKAVEAFAAMLAEVRAYGEGLIISDQSPERLAPDAVRNTNLQIAHQLRHRDDREAIAAAMIMTDAQKEFLGKLKVGQAAVFMTGYDRATFMQVPNYKDTAAIQEPSDDAVRAHMEKLIKEHGDKFETSFLPYDGCRFCQSRCNYRDRVEPFAYDQEVVEQFRQSLMRFEENPARKEWNKNWRWVARAGRQAGGRINQEDAVDAAWCFLAHYIDFPFTKHMRTSFENAFSEVARYQPVEPDVPTG
jgi:hypothetical protein